MNNGTMRNALVTGANRGLGLECARLLADQGLRVFVAGRNHDEMRTTARRMPGTVVPIHMDVTDPESVREGMQAVEARKEGLHVLINNAGVYPSGDANPMTVGSAEMQRTLLTNVLGPHAVLECAIPSLVASGGACVVNVSSGLGSFDLCAGEEAEFRAFVGTCYGTSKAALNMLTVSWAKHLERTPVRVNAVSPGWCQTDMGGRGASRSPEEGARTLLEYAFLDPDAGPTGRFFGPEGEMEW